MKYPGIKNLGDRAITAVLTGEVITSLPDASGNTVAYADRLDDMKAATLQVTFTYGSGGSTLKCMIETTLDQGQTWVEVARAAFTTASAEKLFNLSALTEKLAAYAPAALSDDVGLSGFFGDRWRAKVTSTGIYGGNTSVSVRMNARG
jgi:hypothetical protein